MEKSRMKIEMQSKKHVELCGALTRKHDVIKGLIGDRPFHYVDPPIHGNIGDLLIMHGTLAFFRKTGLSPKLVAPFFAYNTDWVEEGDVIVFHGGGNFGDLYPYFQSLREQVVSTAKNNRIVILPQSLHFSSPEKRKQSAEIFRHHSDVHICVRDRVSFDLALEFTENVYLMPDMAHQLYPIKRTASVPSTGALVISRVDDEKKAIPHLHGIDIGKATDWPGFVGDREQWINLFRRLMGSFYRRKMGKIGNKIFIQLWFWYSARLITDAMTLFSSHKMVVTDRLHGHILACLLDMPNIVLDNNYGKNSRYVNTWTHESDLVTLRSDDA